MVDYTCNVTGSVAQYEDCDDGSQQEINEYSGIIGVIDFGKDGSIEREQFKTILEKSPKLKNYTFDPIELLDKGYTKSKESRHTQLTINDFDFFKLGDFD